MDEAGRRAKKIAETRRLSSLTPAQTIEIGCDLSDFGQELSEAARRAQH